jgi:hypothetical protein
MRWRITAALFVSMVATGAAQAQEACSVKHAQPLLPTDPAMCLHLRDAVRAPSALSLGEYEETLGNFLRGYCHRDADAGWERDKSLRDTGPFISIFQDGEWQGTDHGVHAPVVIWYSPEAADWIRDNRSEADVGTGRDATPMPDGAMLIKEMYPAPASACASENPLTLFPKNGAAVMVRDREASRDGWYWGWFGWEGWTPDWPADKTTNRLPYAGFGQYCVNCHASARDNLTFSSTRNIAGEPGEPLFYLSQDEALHTPLPPAHLAKTTTPPPAAKPDGDVPLKDWLDGFQKAFPKLDGSALARKDVVEMPSQTYDNAWTPANAPDNQGPFLTSDQCLGCHDAGSTGLHFDMTVPDFGTGKLLNLSPYATWRSSPMGLAGRDPIFFAQLASETQSFHPDDVEFVETTCLGCHGVLGQRQAQIDSDAATGQCDAFTRDDVNTIPWPANNAHADRADYGALARDGISCMACHQMAVGTQANETAAKNPRNACTIERQETFNPGATGLARTFTGSFLTGPSDRIIGPVAEPRTRPMQESLGLTPHQDISISSSEACGSCHTVHLPVLHRGKTVAHVYEQTTYAEWAFSDFRTGESPYWDKLPGGAGAIAITCAGCHLRDDRLTRSKIASIQEVSNFPAAEFTAAASELDLPVRDDYSPHVLVGLNSILVRMSRQFPDIFGIRKQDPMLVSKGVPPAAATEQLIYESAAKQVATITVGKPELKADGLHASVAIVNRVGHKFPSGVGFRRAFITFEVLDAAGDVLWASGRTDEVGRLVDRAGTPIAGENWWGPSCTVPADRATRAHQPHFQSVTAESQAQIYQELVSTPPDRAEVSCGHDAKPEGILTTSFLSICAEVKDNRLLPVGYLPLPERKEIARAFGAGDDLAEDSGSTAVGEDPDYRTGGGDSLTYIVPRDAFTGTPVAVRARVYYQPTPPFYLQDRFCSAKGPDTDRLHWLTGHLDLKGTPGEGWKLLVADSGPVKIGN